MYRTNKYGVKPGVYSAIIGCFDEAGKPDHKALKNVVDFNLGVSGVDGLYVNGSTGESFNMTLADRKSTLCAAAEAADGRTGLIAQIGSNAIEEIKELADAAYENGYQAISAVSPYYYSYPKEDIINHYLRVAEYSRLPLIVYNIPVRTSVSLDKSDFGRLFEHKNIAGVKFTSQDMFLLERLRDEFPDKIIFSGYDEFLFSSTILGTDGTIGTTYNVIGKFAKKVFEAVAASDIKAGLAAQRQINTVVELLLETGIFQTIKALIEEYGVKCGECRPPMSKITEKQREQAKKLKAYIESAK